MTDQDIVVKDDAAIQEFDYSSLYKNVEDNYEPTFSPWKVKLLQRNSPEVGEIEGALPGKWMVGPGDGTGRDKFVDELDVLLLDYYTGRIMNELGDDGKPADGTNSKRVCGSLDGVQPFFPSEVREEFGDNAIEIKLSDWRTGDEVVITEGTYCDSCPLSKWGPKDEDGKRLRPPCQPYHRIMLYSFDFNVPLQFTSASFNVLKPLEGRKRGNIPGIRAMSYPKSEGELPAFVLDDGPHAITLSTDSVSTDFGAVKVPVLKYSEAPLTGEQFRGFIEVEKLYSEYKAGGNMDRFDNYEDEDGEGGSPDAGKAKDVLGSGRNKRKRKLGVDEDEL